MINSETKFADDGSLSPATPQDHAMEVLSACDERYLPHAATMLCSLLEHNNACSIHLFYSSIASRELEKLKSLVAGHGSKIALYEMESSDFEHFRVGNWTSIASYYRILAPRLLPTEINKVLYLDADIIIRRPLNTLWHTDLTDHALAAVKDEMIPKRAEVLGLPVGTKYFNAGVLLINLRFWRENDVSERVIAFIKDNPEILEFHDQDALNATLVDQWVELSPRWNWQYCMGTSMPEAEVEPAIVHFLTTDKPWHWFNAHPFKSEYHKYRIKTPWREYRQEGQPSLPQRLYGSVRRFARLVLPGSLQQWLRSLATNRA